jgi:Arc/MetJ-type ribon-helix-helix transcriptional regulator
MTKRKVRIRAARLEPELDRRIEVATKQGGFSNPSAFIRAAIERELTGRESGVDAAEERIAASLDRVMREIRGVRLGQQALFAFVDSLVKTVLTCLAEPPTDAYEQAIARGKFRYDRFLKSVGASMAGDSHAAMAELLKRADEGR